MKIEIIKGTTVAIPIRMESSLLVYKPVAAMVDATPLRLTVTDHGMPADWRSAFTNVAGLESLGAANMPPRDRDMHRVVAVDANTIEFNAIDAEAYGGVSGGHVVYFDPLDLSIYNSADLVVRDKAGAALATYSLTIDAALNALWLNLTSVASAAIAYTAGVGRIQATRIAGQVDALSEWDVQISIL